MKKKFNLGDLPYALFLVLIAIGAIAILVDAIKAIIKIVTDIKEIIKEINDFYSFFIFVFVFILTILFIKLIIYVVNNWGRKDDFFFFIVNILNSPSNYIYEKRKNELINYRNEVKQLTDYIEYFSTITSKETNKEISNEEFLLFVEKVKAQNEFLEKNRRKLEKEDNKINIFIQVLFLLLGIISTLFF